MCISDPKTGKTFKKDVKEQEAQGLMGLNIGENVKGDDFGLGGFELQVTGGSDFCGFPMRSGILGIRKKISLLGGVGFKGAGKGIHRRKTVCGHKINSTISQVNLKVVKEGAKSLATVLGGETKEAEKEPKKEEKAKEAHKAEEKKAEKK